MALVASGLCSDFAVSSSGVVFTSLKRIIAHDLNYDHLHKHCDVELM